MHLQPPEQEMVTLDVALAAQGNMVLTAPCDSCSRHQKSLEEDGRSANNISDLGYTSGETKTGWTELMMS